MNRRIYMDNHATTRVDPRVLEAMLPYFSEVYGNPASRAHEFGSEARSACEQARAQVAALIGGQTRGIVFTSGATESNNLALRGVSAATSDRPGHIVTVATEHPSVLETCRDLERSGSASITVLGVDSTGLVDPAEVKAAIRRETVLVSVMHANNEIGTIHPITEISRITREAGVPLHVDATQSVGREPLDVERMNIDLLSLSAHKLYGPKGCGALYVRPGSPRLRVIAQNTGGGHERGLRSGTLNTAGIVGFGRACEIAGTCRIDEQDRVRALRDRLEAGLRTRIDQMELNGHPSRRLAGNLNVSFAWVEAESLLGALRGIAVSSGSACTSATLEPSHVLKSIGLDEERAQSSIRFGLGRFNGEDEVDHVVECVGREVARLRGLSAGWAGRQRHAAGAA